MNLKDYQVCLLRDNCEFECIYNVVLLNKKHKVKDFQDEIYSARHKHKKEIDKYGNDIEYVFTDETLNKKFDYFLLEVDEDKNTLII